MPSSSSQPSNIGYPTRRPARWKWSAADPARTDRLIAATGLPPLLAKILVARGLGDPACAERFLRPSLAHLYNPFDLKGMDEAVVRIEQALKNDEAIWIYGDYDVDGITATAILLLTLRELGKEAEYYIPHRLSEGYGLHMEAIEQLAQEGARLIITVDCGVTAVREAALARELGMDLIVTDHHEPGPELPPAVAVINPKQPGCAYPFKGLSGAGVAFKLAHALLKRLHPEEAGAREFLKSLLDLAALGTVADIVPLMDENRAIVTHGLSLLRLCKRTGLMHLMERAALSPSQLDATAISFVIAPRLNAAGRTEHAMFGVELLMTDDNQRARELARQLEGFNENRRDIEQSTVEEALVLLETGGEDPVIVVSQEGWHQGVIGIVASRLLGQFYRPTIVIGMADGAVAKGSGRSIPGFDLLEALKACGEHLLQFGGHKMAAGLAIDPERIDAFRLAINEYARRVLPAEMMHPLVSIDADATPADLTAEVIGRLGELAPFGPENPKPVLALEGYRLIEEPRVLRGRHLKLHCASPDGRPLAALGWGMAGRLDELAGRRGALRLAGTPMLNTWNGRTSVELELKDFKVC